MFTLTCLFAQYLFNMIKALQESDKLLLGRNIVCLHGKMNTRQQLRNYTQFYESPSAVLLTTDIAARGLDIESLTSVI